MIYNCSGIPLEFLYDITILLAITPQIYSLYGVDITEDPESHSVRGLNKGDSTRRKNTKRQMGGSQDAGVYWKIIVLISTHQKTFDLTSDWNLNVAMQYIDKLWVEKFTWDFIDIF